MGVNVRWSGTKWIFLILLIKSELNQADDYNQVNRDGSFQFGYDTPDSFHNAQANRNNVVQGQFGGRNPKTGAIDTVSYTAGNRGFRPRGKNIVRNYDFSQSGPRPIGSIDDPYFDPNEDPSYKFAFRTKTYSRQEAANSVGDVSGKYSYLDDVGERHNVEFIAGKNTGFHVKTPYPDSNPRAYGPLYFRGRGRPYPRGRTSIQRGLDGSYRFVSAGADQRRTETSDSSGNVRGSYTYLDDKGVQHSVHYIAGPGIGYRVLKNVKQPHLPNFYPFGRPDIIPPDFYDYPEEDVFDTAATGQKPKGSSRPSKPDTIGGSGVTDVYDSFDTRTTPSSIGNFPFSTTLKPHRPSYDDFGDDDDGGDLFGDTSSSPAKPRPRPQPSATPRPPAAGTFDGGNHEDGYDDGSYKPSGEGAYQDGGGNKRPRPRPVDSNSFGNNRPKPTFGDLDDNDLNDSDLFDRPQPEGAIKKPSQDVGFSDGSFTGINLSGGKGTIVTNVGEKPFSVPPGVSVRAHVQAIDLLPLGPRSLSPSDQLKAETRITEDVITEVSDHYKASASEITESKLSTETSDIEQSTLSASTIGTETSTVLDVTTKKIEVETKVKQEDDDNLSLFK